MLVVFACVLLATGKLTVNVELDGVGELDGYLVVLMSGGILSLLGFIGAFMLAMLVETLRALLKR